MDSLEFPLEKSGPEKSKISAQILETKFHTQEGYQQKCYMSINIFPNITAKKFKLCSLLGRCINLSQF